MRFIYIIRARSSPTIKVNIPFPQKYTLSKITDPPLRSCMNLSKLPVPSNPTLNANHIPAAYKTISINPRMVRVEDVRLCKNCKHFQPIEYYANKEDGYCKLFGKMNVVNGDMAYKFASEARDAPTQLTDVQLNSKGLLDSEEDGFLPMCGIEAVFFEEADPSTLDASPPTNWYKERIKAAHSPVDVLVLENHVKKTCFTCKIARGDTSCTTHNGYGEENQ